MKRANITAAEKIAKKGKGSVIIYIGADGKPKKPQVVDTFQVSGGQAVNIKHFRELKPIYVLQQEAEEAQLVNFP
jgi:hypothetical protein